MQRFNPPIDFLMSHAEHHLALLKERDDSREVLLKLLAAEKAQADWTAQVLSERQLDNERLRVTFPECCTTPLAFASSGVMTIESIFADSCVPFLPCRLAVDPECAPYFDVVDFRIGNRSQVWGTERLACTLFPPIGEGKEFEAAHAKLAMHFSILYPGVKMSLHVQRSDYAREPRPFRAALWGKAYDSK